MARLSGSASIEIDASLERVWDEVRDVESTPEWQAGLDEMVVLERDDHGRPSLVRSETDAKVRRIKTVVRFRYDPPTRLSWSQQQGDLSKLDGAWLLEDLGSGRTRATYTLDGDPGRVLGMLVRGPVQDNLRAMFVDARPGELKRRIEDR